MSKQNRLFWQDEIEKWVFQCVGCECLHGFTRQWTFNGNMKKPTVCHFFIRDGKIIYLEDSTHALKGRTVDIPLWEEV